ncbi:uncharacterized protein HaLaN_21715 [Haematococcus lacustris]|uniref:Uncharacterized protein n=1 Tax=Haematococcus lacustris TaxID=44745 RepID=A0A699ZPY9_HAELA|nr:uncharacterized protein HaLaN_21715 [Haematococcus lacustris]
MPPEGWSAAPALSNSTGSAWECTFEKQLPLRASLKSGGPVFVLKGTAGKSDSDMAGTVGKGKGVQLKRPLKLYEDVEGGQQPALV